MTSGTCQCTAWCSGASTSPLRIQSTKGGNIMQWVDPAFCDIRLGFEVTAYVYVR